MISFSSVLYGFRSNPMLDNVSFHIPANSIVVFTGKDEAAQNGIYDLLLKLNRQHEGVISIDGVDINEIDDESYFDIVSSVRRNHSFFDVSIKENLMMINSNFDRILEMCQRLGLDSEIQNLEKGYDTVLTDSTPISQSTRALLVVARTLLDESRILLLDDIMNLLDDKTERKVLNYLLELKSNHTIVIVSCSKKVIDKADLVYDVTSKKITSIET